MILSRAGEIMHRFMLQLNEWRNFSTKLTHEGMKAFELLGISSSSTPDECKKAYLNLACSIHPYVKNDSIDSNDNNDLQKKANIEFHRLHQAYTLAYKICANNHQLSRNDCLLKQLDYDIREFRNKAPHSFIVLIEFHRPSYSVDNTKLTKHRMCTMM
uniref:Heat shock protein DnaJ, N-terminal,domain-containing protein n=1 Tax=Schistosoma japonicum TaxID=6182 RepID=C1L4R4_SCHJA|nr:Heat shock protein DnaJ, N-terminal,domain-containing protein [Schistosoma japonicum]